MKISEMNDFDLIKSVESAYNAVYVYECYSTKDLMFYERGVSELIERGYTVNERTELVIE